MTVKFSSSFRRVWRNCILAAFLSVLLGAAGSRAIAAQSVELTWNPSPSAGVVSYKVYYGTQSGLYPQNATSYSTNITVPGLQPGKTYHFAVAAVDGNGVESALSNEATFAAPPLPDQIVLQAQAAQALQAVALSWNPSADSDVYAYQVEYGTRSGVYNNSNTFSTTDGVILGLAGGTTNYFKVSAIDIYGYESARSAETAYVVPTLAPLVLQVQASSSARDVNLAWNPSSDSGVYAYNVYYGIESGVYNNAATCYATSGVISGLSSGTNYFAVSAIDVYGGESALSKEASFVVPVPAPAALQMQTLTDDNGRPYYLVITAAGAVSGSWEMDYSTDLQNWYYSGYSGNGSGSGNDVNVSIPVDPNEPQMFFRLINH